MQMIYKKNASNSLLFINWTLYVQYMNKLYTNKAIVFGGSGDVGIDIAKDLLKKNYKLIISYKNQKLSKLKKTFKNYNKNNIFLKYCDLSNEKSIKRVIQFSKKKIGEPGLVINTAGIFYYDNLSKFSYKKIIETFKINCFSIIAINKELTSIKKNKKLVKIISLGSSSALDGFADTFSYCGSKHALLGIIKSLNKTRKNKNILNYCVNVGSIKNSMGKKVRSTEFKKFIDQKSVVQIINYIQSTNLPAFPEEIFLKRFRG